MSHRLIYAGLIYKKGKRWEHAPIIINNCAKTVTIAAFFFFSLFQESKSNHSCEGVSIDAKNTV